MSKPGSLHQLIAIALMGACASLVVLPYRTLLLGVELNSFRLVFLLCVVLSIGYIAFCPRIRPIEADESFFAALLFWLSATIIWSPEKYETIRNLIDLWVYFLYYLMIKKFMAVYVTGSHIVRAYHFYFSIAMVCAASLVCFSAVYGSVRELPINANQVALVAISCLTMTMIGPFTCRGLLIKGLGGLFSVILILILLTLGSRSGLVALIVVVLSFFFIFSWKKPGFLLTVVVLLCGITVFFVVTPKTSEELTYTLTRAQSLSFIMNNMSPRDPTEMMDATGKARYYMYELAFWLISENPVRGYGYGAFKSTMESMQPGRGVDVHNDFLKLIVGGGLIAGVLWCGWIGSLITRGLRAKRLAVSNAERNFYWAILIGFVGQLVLAMANPMMTWPFLYLNAALLGAAGSACQRRLLNRQHNTVCVG